ncbi:MAG TPA: hypothetical protein VFI31_14885 [Pirellulales bacterium]|nr:hypothetical protein [Pirellulales bacterium]
MGHRDKLIEWKKASGEWDELPAQEKQRLAHLTDEEAYLEMAAKDAIESELIYFNDDEVRSLDLKAWEAALSDALKPFDGQLLSLDSAKPTLTSLGLALAKFFATAKGLGFSAFQTEVELSSPDSAQGSRPIAFDTALAEFKKNARDFGFSEDETQSQLPLVTGLCLMLIERAAQSRELEDDL